jgi:hypothetical protein
MRALHSIFTELTVSVDDNFYAISEKVAHFETTATSKGYGQ